MARHDYTIEELISAKSIAARIEALGLTPVVSPGDRVLAGPQPDQPEGYLWRCALMPGGCWDGPTVIEEYASTTVVPAGWSARLLGDGQLLLEHRD